MIGFVAKYATFLRESVDNLRSGICKNSLIFLNELLSGEAMPAAQTDELTLVLKEVMPSVLIKTNYEKVFISKPAKEVMSQTIAKCPYTELLRILMNCPSNKILAL